MRGIANALAHHDVMIGVLILTHGCLGQEMLAAGRMIAGELEHFEALCLTWNDDLESGREKLAPVLDEMDDGEGVLILTDIYGGTPSNIAHTFHRAGRVEVVTGVNLPMVVSLGCLVKHPTSVTELAEAIRTKGRKSIRRMTTNGALAPPVAMPSVEKCR